MFTALFHQKLWAIASAILVASFASHSIALAEVRTFYGLPFEVAAISPMDNASVEVSVLGESRIIPKEDLPRYIAERYVVTPGGLDRFSKMDLESYVRAALAAQDFRSAALMIPPILMRGAGRSAMARKFFEDIGPGAVVAFKDALLQLISGLKEERFGEDLCYQLAPILYVVAWSDMVWLHQYVPRLTLVCTEPLHDYLYQKFASVISGSNSAEVERLFRTAIDLYGPDDALSGHIRVAKEVFDRVILVKEGGDPADLYPLTESCRKDELCWRTAYPLVVEVLLEITEKDLLAADPLKALSALSHIEFEKRTPRTMDLARAAIDAMWKNGIAWQSDTAAGAWIRRIALIDPSTWHSFERYLEDFVTDRVAQGDVLGSEGPFRELVQLRPDPNSKNDVLRIEQAIRYLHDGNQRLAMEKVNSVVTGIPLLDRFRLGISGLTIRKSIIYSILAVPFFAMLLCVWVELKLRAMRRKKAQSKETVDETVGCDETASASTQGTQPLGVLRERQLKEEYIELLTILGLEPTATLREIKAAFRKAAKNLHPDVQKTHVSREFVQITTSYDRILAIRRELELLDDEN